LTCLEFVNTPSEYRIAVLSILGRQLQSLHFYGTQTIDVIKELSPYHQLEELIIGNDYSLLPPPVAADDFPSADNFLPRLKKFEIRICLGPWSPLFECFRPSLTDIGLGCAHIGTSRSQFNWIEVPNLWPNLREMTLLDTRFNRFAWACLREIFSQFKNLRSLTLPPSYGSEVQSKFMRKKLKAALMNPEDPNDSVCVRFADYPFYEINHY